VIKFILFLFLVPFATWAQDPNLGDVQLLKQSGQIFTVRLAPGEKNLKIYLAGKESSTIDWTKANLEVNRIKANDFREPYKVIQRSDHFYIEDFDHTQPVNIEVKARHKDKLETFQFRVKNRLN
jgi:hypothetical protein